MATDTAAMRDLLSYITRELASNADALQIEANEDDSGSITFNVHADKDDLGKLIGRNGKTAKSIRHLLSLLADDQDCRVNVEFIE